MTVAVPEVSIADPGRPPPSVRIPFAPMERALIAQTAPGRPTTTHHVLEFARPVAATSVLRAVENLLRACPVLRSTLHESLWRVVREAHAFEMERARACVESVSVPADVETCGWVDRPFDLAVELPVRVRYGPTERGTHAIVFTLHHSVTDGVGALALFHALLEGVVAAESGRPMPVIAFPSGEGVSVARAFVRAGPAFTLGLASRALRSAFRFWQSRASLLDEDTGRVDSFGLAVRSIPVPVWRALRSRAESLGCTRNDLLCVAALRAADDLRRQKGAPEQPFRLLGGVDLRPFFDAGTALSNWLGTLEIDVSPAEVRRSDAPALVHAKLLDARRPVEAAVTPVLLGLLGRALPPRAFRGLFERSLAPGRRHPYSLLLSHIRPTGTPCWPDALEPVRLWCASTLPRHPGLGLTVTTVGEQVTVTACWPRPLLHDDTVAVFLERMMVGLESP